MRENLRGFSLFGVNFGTNFWHKFANFGNSPYEANCNHFRKSTQNPREIHEKSTQVFTHGFSHPKNASKLAPENRKSTRNPREIHEKSTQKSAQKLTPERRIKVATQRADPHQIQILGILEILGPSVEARHKFWGCFNLSNKFGDHTCRKQILKLKTSERGATRKDLWIFGGDGNWKKKIKAMVLEWAFRMHIWLRPSSNKNARQSTMAKRQILLIPKILWTLLFSELSWTG